MITDRKEFRAVYKCRLCGECDDSTGFGGTTITAIRMATEVIHDGDARLSKGDGIGVQRESVHYCKNGGVGIADFVGFRQC